MSALSKLASSRAPLTRWKADLLLLIAATAWGSGFVIQRLAAVSLGVFVFNGLRFLLGALLILPLIRRPDRGNQASAAPAFRWWALAAGLLLFGASGLQQAGMKTTTAANGGFITGLYVVLVPFLLLAIWRQRVPVVAWAAALLAAVGAFLLSTGGASIAPVPGDGLVLAGSVLWALHVIVVGLAARRFDSLRFAVAQFIVCGAANLAAGLALESHTLAALLSTGWTVLYSAVFSVAIGFTLQVIGQQHTSSGDAALILSLESVFAALFGYLFLSESLLPVQVAGCALIFAAVILAQMDGLRRPAAQSAPPDPAA